MWKKTVLTCYEDKKLKKHDEKDTGDTRHYKFDELLQRNGRAVVILSNSLKCSFFKLVPLLAQKPFII